MVWRFWFQDLHFYQWLRYKARWNLRTVAPRWRYELPWMISWACNCNFLKKLLSFFKTQYLGDIAALNRLSAPSPASVFWDQMLFFKVGEKSPVECDLTIKGECDPAAAREKMAPLFSRSLLSVMAQKSLSARLRDRLLLVSHVWEPHGEMEGGDCDGCWASLGVMKFDLDLCESDPSQLYYESDWGRCGADGDGPPADHQAGPGAAGGVDEEQRSTDKRRGSVNVSVSPHYKSTWWVTFLNTLAECRGWVTVIVFNC